MAREVDVLDARGIFDGLFQKKLSKDAQKKVDNATDDSSCHLYNAYTRLGKSHEKALNELKGKMNATVEDKGVKKAYKKLAGQYTKLIKDAKNEAKKHEKALKKHGVKDIAARCTHTSTHSNLHKSTAKPHAAHSNTHNSEATPQHESQPNSQPEPHSEPPSGAPAN